MNETNKNIIWVFCNVCVKLSVRYDCFFVTKIGNIINMYQFFDVNIFKFKDLF